MSYLKSGNQPKKQKKTLLIKNIENENNETKL